MGQRNIDWTLLKDEYIPYPPFQRHIHGLPPKQRIVDWREDALDFRYVVEYSSEHGLEGHIVGETYRKQTVFRITAGKYQGRIFIDLSRAVPVNYWETLH